jgi:hypothetical protein
VADQALDLGTRRVRSKQKAPLAVRKTLWRMPGDFPKNVNGRPKNAGKSFFSIAMFLKEESNGQPDAKGRGIQLKMRSSFNEEMRSVPQKTGFRCPLS